MPNHDDEVRVRWQRITDAIDGSFAHWMLARYATLHSQPPSPPVMPHHVARFLARLLDEEKSSKVALVLVDGLALDQWVTAKEELSAQLASALFHEDALFAWVPTLTMVSRQALFAGRVPLFFQKSIHTTEREPGHWRRLWQDQGLDTAEVSYVKNLGEVNSLEEVEVVASHPKVRCLGLVIDKVDKIMHGMQLGAAGMHNQVRQWSQAGFLRGLIELLHERGFRVFLTADHGNVDAKGIGRPGEGALAEVRGERARVYPDEALRARVNADFPDAVAWPAIGLPADYLPLLAPGTSAFTLEGKKTVEHGGLSLQEVLIPFVEIGRRA